MADGMMNRSTVLVVDDTPESLSFLTDTLDKAGMTVLVAVDGESALELLEQVTPDLVLMDAVMPVLDGFETCRRLKQDARLSHLPVIFMTGLAETEHVVQGLAAGGVDYVTKPLVIDELLARIRVHLANARVSHGSQLALDTSGRYLISVDGQGRLLWCTPRAGHVLAERFPGWHMGQPDLPQPVAQKLERLRTSRGDDMAVARLDLGDCCLEFTLLSRVSADEYLFRMSESRTGSEAQRLQEHCRLTAREAEVLLWLSRGKANREISEILNISPRTVNKHLEQVFEKLGVENRASAAAIAVRILAQWG